MKVISQTELDKEFEFLEKQNALLKTEREKIMLERSRLYYQWKEIQETDESIQKDQEIVNSLWNNLQFELQKVNNEYTTKTNEEIAKIRKEKNDELEAQLTEDRDRLDKIKKNIYKEETIAAEKIRKDINDELELQIAKDRKRLDQVRKDLHELIAIEESKITTIKQKNLI
jgi:hypothetical protein